MEKSKLVLIFCALHSINAIQNQGPLFHNGRPKGGFVGAPYVNPKQNLQAAEAQWFTQRLNHFDGQDSRTWQQRYFVNATNFGMGGPVFLMIGGEGPLSAFWVAVGSMVENAERNKALVIALEHRYYGKSHPTSDVSVENLKYLSSEQALADIAHFIEAMVVQFSLTETNKWITFGGSYPGALSAWFRYKYPHLVYGAIASSAPIQAQMNFPEYLEVSTDSLGTQLCKDTVQTATSMTEKYTLTGSGRKYLTELFHLCEPLTDDPNDIAQFTSTIAGNFFGVIQYNKDNRAFEGAVGTNITVDFLCTCMTLPVFGNELQRYAKVNEIIMHTYNQTCISPSYKTFINEMKQTEWKSAEGGLLRPFSFYNLQHFCVTVQNPLNKYDYSIYSKYNQTCISPSYKTFINEMKQTEWKSAEGGLLRPFSFYNLQHFCVTVQNPLNKYDYSIYSKYNQTYISPNYKTFINEMKQTEWKSAEGGLLRPLKFPNLIEKETVHRQISAGNHGFKIAFLGRQWIYQTCTEFGYYQSTDSNIQVYGTTFPLSFWTKQCVDIFGSIFNETSIERGVDWTNDNYGGYSMNQPRIIFPNGSIDPWHALSFTEDQKDLIAIYIKGTAHCANMYPSSGDDSNELKMARQQISNHIAKWLQDVE